MQKYRSVPLLLLPESETWLASINVRSADFGEGADETFQLLRRFLSAACWALPCGVKEWMRGGGDRPNRMGRGRGNRPYIAPKRERAQPIWAPEPSDEKALLALALFREGRSEQSDVYRFLSFFKVVETVAQGKRSILELIVRHLPEAREGARRSTSLNELNLASDSDLAQFLYEQCRCAIAHAHSHPLVDPDNSRHTSSIAEYVPLVQALALTIIQREYGIPRWPPRDWSPEWQVVSLSDF